MWLGSKSGATVSVTLDVTADLPAGGAHAVLVTLSGNSTNGDQSALPITAGSVSVTASEMPSFILLGAGLAPKPPIGPVAPVDPPVAPACASLPRGLHYTGTGTYSGGFIICPKGDAHECSDGASISFRLVFD